jgi:hypothetical protein
MDDEQVDDTVDTEFTVSLCFGLSLMLPADEAEPVLPAVPVAPELMLLAAAASVPVTLTWWPTCSFRLTLLPALSSTFALSLLAEAPLVPVELDDGDPYELLLPELFNEVGSTFASTYVLGVSPSCTQPVNVTVLSELIDD